MTNNTAELTIESVLAEAERIINGQRRKDYGGVLESFTQVGDYWSVYINRLIDGTGRISLGPLDVANLMILMKVSRAQNGYHRDSYVDIAGYSGCTEKIIKEMDDLSVR